MKHNFGNYKNLKLNLMLFSTSVLISSKASDDWLGVYTYLFIPYPVKKDKFGLEEKLNVKKSKKKYAFTKEFSD